MRVLVALLLLVEPLRFAVEALTVFPTIAYRGPLAGAELVVHGIVAALSAAGGLALLNAAPAARAIASAGIVASVLRTLQSLYWSVLPNNTAPGDELLFAVAATFLGAVALVGIWRGRTD